MTDKKNINRNSKDLETIRSEIHNRLSKTGEFSEDEVDEICDDICRRLRHINGRWVLDDIENNGEL